LEYAWGTDGNSSGSFPGPVTFGEDGLLKITAPLSSLPEDVELFGEQSPDLLNWSTEGVVTLEDAFGFPEAGTEHFIRVGVRLLP
jgi:hypothetical protein